MNKKMILQKDNKTKSKPRNCKKQKFGYTVIRKK